MERGVLDVAGGPSRDCMVKIDLSSFSSDIL